MKLEDGMYVRLENDVEDIVIINKIANVFETTILTENDGSIYQGEYTKENVIKASYNIIDILEVGDYVNELPVEDYYTRYDEEKDDYIKIGIVTLEDYWKGTFTSVEDIKSIVTKEQFESMSYKVGE